MPGLDRKLTLYWLTMIAVGSCIGSGTFVTPYEVAGVFVLISTAFVLNTLYQRPAQVWAGLFMLGLGMATFRLFRYK